MVASAILQWQVYKTSPCGYNASECEDANGFALVSPISIWAQIPLYALPAAGEVFVFVTVYEQGALTAHVSDGSARLTSFACPRLQLSSARLVRAELGAAHRRPSLLTLTCTAPVPERMKGLVYAFMLCVALKAPLASASLRLLTSNAHFVPARSCRFTTALSSAIVEIITPALHDPHLIWPFVGIAAANAVAMVFIWLVSDRPP
jgi:hypothetical protein